MLNSDQQWALEALIDFALYSEDNEFILTGSPGTGKSFLLDHFFSELKNQQKKMVGMGIPQVFHDAHIVATTNKASSIIGATGTIHKSLYLTPKTDKKTGESYLQQYYVPWYKDNLFIIDECSMIDEKVYKFIKKDILNMQGNKIIYVGDRNQLPPVKSKFSIFTKGIPQVELREFMRFDSPDIKDLIQELRDNIGNPNKIKDIFKNLKDSEHIHRVETPDEIEAVFKKFGVSDKVLAFTKKNVENINKFFRKMYGKPEEITKGDLVEMGSTVSTSTGRSYTGASDVVTNVVPGKAWDKITLKNFGTFYSYVDLEKYDEELKRLHRECYKKKNFTDVDVFTGQILKLSFGYASTVHKAQGSTYDKVCIDIQDICKCKEPDTMAKLFYVACSRAKKELYLYYGE